MPATSFKTKDGSTLLLQGVKAQGRVVGRMLDMTLEQRFRNPESFNVEVVYTFPLPWHAVLLGLEVELNGQTLVGVVQRKAKAREEYEEAVSEGDSAILVTVNRDRSYTLELGNLMADESCVVRLHYVQILQPEQGSLRLMLPTTLAPKYGHAVRDGGYEPHAAPEASATVEYPFDIRLDIQGELVHAQIGSPSHPVAIRTLPAVGMKETFITQVHLGSKAWLDRDFVLVFDKLTHSSLGLAAWDHLDAGLGVVMASFTPALPTRQSLPVTMKVLVDCSGSMNGDSIQAARSALQTVLASLRDGDRFSLSRFGDSVEHRCKALWKVAPPSMAAAQRWAVRLEADMGGTEMNNAILSTLVLPGAERSDLLLITDGEIHAIDAVVESAQRSGHRFFVVGIGASVAEGLLRQLANQTGGSCEFVTAGEHVEGAIKRLYQRMRSPKVTHARVAWPAQCEVHAASDLPLSVFDGDDINVFARLKAQQAEALTGNVRLLGRVDGVEGEVCLGELKPSFIADEANTLARLAANQRYWQLKGGAEGVPAVLTKQLPALAEKYQLVTDDSSFILVKQRAEGEKAVDMPELRTVQGMLAAGHGGHGGVTAGMVLGRYGSSTTPFSVVNSVGASSVAGMAVPTVWRSAPRYSRQDPSAVDRLLFSKKAPSGGKSKLRSKALRDFIDSIGSDDSPDTKRAKGWKAPPSRDAFWAVHLERSEDGASRYEGLTPAGLVEGLRLNRPEFWPTSYSALATIGVGDRVIEWLELSVGATTDETAVVLAFLEVMHTLDFTIKQTFQAAFGKITSMPTKADALSGVYQAIEAALVGITAEHWPAMVLDYAEAEHLLA
ncbi:VIT domain-containing protein [Hydrogenophaga atypica]|uniref:VIT domain-containing protein n=1 Tax=Hydrogenophaga atypica TaxID=249409 RepID=A0ABW2QJK7_9BURK